MSWKFDLIKEADKELEKLDGSLRFKVFKTIKRVLKNPENYGKPLGNKNGIDLTGFYKIKLKSSGIRVVYKLVKTGDTMLIIVIGARADEEVYHLANKRIKKYGL